MLAAKINQYTDRNIVLHYKYKLALCKGFLKNSDFVNVGTVRADYAQQSARTDTLL